MPAIHTHSLYVRSMRVSPKMDAWVGDSPMTAIKGTRSTRSHGTAAVRSNQNEPLVYLEGREGYGGRWRGMAKGREVIHSPCHELAGW